MPRTKEPFFKAFKKFITRGNVLDMAVGVVVGGSFSKIVNGLVNYVINPFVGIFIKGGSLDSIKTVIHPAVEEVVDEVTGEVITAASSEVAILWGTWLQTIIDFLIVSISHVIRNNIKEHTYKDFCMWWDLGYINGKDVRGAFSVCSLLCDYLEHYPKYFDKRERYFYSTKDEVVLRLKDFFNFDEEKSCLYYLPQRLRSGSRHQCRCGFRLR